MQPLVHAGREARQGCAGQEARLNLATTREDGGGGWHSRPRGECSHRGLPNAPARGGKGTFGLPPSGLTGCPDLGAGAGAWGGDSPPHSQSQKGGSGPTRQPRLPTGFHSSRGVPGVGLAGTEVSQPEVE